MTLGYQRDAKSGRGLRPGRTVAGVIVVAARLSKPLPDRPHGPEWPERQGARTVRTVLIGLDWGTTSLRAYRIGAGGTVIERREMPQGIMQVKDGAFAAAFADAVSDWTAAGVPVLASGMIGSRQGWREAPYVECPCSLEALANGLIEVPGGPRIVPGLLRPAGADKAPDVMRGEETQLFGLAAEEALVVLPGTHSKWARVERGRVVDFATYLTGEMFDVLRRHSILGRLMEGEAHHPGAFTKGVRAAAEPGQFLHTIFSARTLPLTGGLRASEVWSYLSGLLIGTEVAAALAGRQVQRVTILGSSTLAKRYTEALALHEVEAVAADPDVVVTGLYRISVAAGLVEVA
jgi:2-dehydro-3-deoxygalactonokinase